MCDGIFVLEEFDTLSKLNSKSKLTHEINKQWKENFLFLLKNQPQSLIDQRLRQLEIYLKIDGIKGITMAILDIIKNDSLEGDFEFLKKIVVSVSYVIFYIY